MRRLDFKMLEKFHNLAERSDLRDLLPANAVISSPQIIDASETITAGCICVENRDAVYEHVRSSIKDSLWGKGARVAVLNDEVHHVVNDNGAKVKRWKEFLQNTDYGFRFILGFSGTCWPPGYRNTIGCGRPLVNRLPLNTPSLFRPPRPGLRGFIAIAKPALRPVPFAATHGWPAIAR